MGRKSFLVESVLPEMSNDADPISSLAHYWNRLREAASRFHESQSHDSQQGVTARATEVARHDSTLAALKEQFDLAGAEAKTLVDQKRDHALSHYEERVQGLDGKAREAEEEIDRRAEAKERDVKEAYQQALWLADSVFEAGENAPRVQFEERRGELHERAAALEAILAEATKQTHRFRQAVPEVPSELEELDVSTAAMALASQVAFASDAVHRLRRLRIPLLFRGPILLVPAILISAGAAGGAFLAGARGTQLAMAAGFGVVLLVVMATVLWFVARKQVQKAWGPLHRAAIVGRRAAELRENEILQQREQSERSAKDRLKAERDAAHAKWRPVLESIRVKREARRLELGEKLPDRRTRIERERSEAVSSAESCHRETVESAQRAYDEAVAKELWQHTTTMGNIKHECDDRDVARNAQWLSTRDAFQSWANESMSIAREVRPDLQVQAELTHVFPSHLFVGNITLSAATLPNGAPEVANHPWVAGHQWTLPLLRQLPGAPSLIIEAPAEQRAAGMAALQAAATRLLVQSPPGKVRLTLIDPVGLGQSFAAFMHLADEMEQLVGERIWTEARHIEQKLTDLTEHMETVIQKYLRDEYSSVVEYNAQAGQLAEPLRVIVMADFPVGLNDNSMRRLNSILQSGARCGVHVLVLRDPIRPYPHGILEADLLRCCRRIRWHDGAFRLDDPELAAESVVLDQPPTGARLQELLRSVGQSAKKASVVQVPFSAIEPSEARIWCGSTAESVHIPIGRTGATQLQQLLLGEGTKQHVLIAGKTGSGKSTLLNAMIVNACTWFSPDEIELWLIDFKKGVEFKVYAHHRLPHARVVAVESDREFGLSVLQGLDAELKRRGDLFRSVGVQDLAAWRRSKSAEHLPRALLIVDEFQELFVEEDKVSQEAALLLDRLVRQGRAFGMHVILGSQTLGGAYALPRTTMGQMGVRVALQCNEADASLILSDDNTAARLLSRPGEAIYNDAGGLLEGNSPFQVVWLGDVEREQRVQALAQRGQATASRRAPMIVFDGTTKVSLAHCRSLRDRTMQGGSASGLPLHLGEPVAIRDATVAMLGRKSGANVLVVGQDDRMAMGISIAVLASLRAAIGARAKLWILDGCAADAAEAGMLASSAAALGLTAQVPGYRDVENSIRDIGALVAQRTESGRTDEPTVVLLAHGLQRFRSLRRDENDFSFSSEEGSAKADRVFGAILRDGPSVGVHVVAWADTAASVQRYVDRAAMREFDFRILMQMGANDSSALIDSPAASRLGSERALLFSEERGTVERFRPFEPASAETCASLFGVAASMA